MTPLAILRAAHTKIANPKHWTQGVFARRDDGSRTDATSADAVCWCPVGACFAVQDNYRVRKDDAWAYLDRAAVELGSESGPRYNDAKGRKHSEVLALFDRAIQIAEREASQ